MQHGHINTSAQELQSRLNSLLHFRTVVASAGLSWHTALPFMEAQVDHSCQVLLLFPPPPRCSFNFLNCHSWLVLHCSSPSFRQTHRRAKQFPHLHAWGDTVSFKRSSTLKKMQAEDDAVLHQRFGVGFTLTASLSSSTTCNHCQDQAGEIQMLPHLTGALPFAGLTAGHCCATEYKVPVKKPMMS